MIKKQANGQLALFSLVLMVSPHVIQAEQSVQIQELENQQASQAAKNSKGAKSLETSETRLVITARKRPEYKQEVPVALTVFDNQSLNLLEMNRADHIARLTPNLHWKTAGGAGSNVAIRGVSDNSFHPNQAGAVGLYVDEVSLNSSVASLFPLFDTIRVEVLRGPQNTLYGRNTTGGAINYVSNRPYVGQALNGHTSLSLGNFNSLDWQGAAGFSLSQDAAARIALFSQKNDGFYTNDITRQDESDLDRQAARLQLLWLLNDDLEMRFSWHQGKDRGQSRRYKSIGLLDPLTGQPCPNSTSVGNGCGDLFGFVDSNDFSQVSANLPKPKQNIDMSGASLHLNWDLSDELTFTSISAIERNDLQRNEDSDAGPFDIFEFHQLSDARQLSQEFRLASSSNEDFTWLAGLYYFDEDFSASSATALRFVPAFPGGAGGATIAEQNNQLWSLYGQTEFHLAAQWQLTAGLRFTQETKQGVNQAFRHSAGAIVPLGELIGAEDVIAAAFVVLDPAEFDSSWKDWGGHLGVSFTSSADDLYYATLSRGFKGGGINLGPQQAFIGFAGETVDPEYLTTLELGAKTRWLKDTLELDWSIFYNDYSDQQVFQVVSTDFGPGPLHTNAGQSVTQGMELELRWHPLEGSLIAASLGLLGAEFKDFDSGQEADYSGNNLVQAPPVSFNLLLKQDWRLASGQLTGMLNATYTDKQDFSVTNDTRLAEPSYSLVDLRLAYQFGSLGQYQVALWGKNMTDESFCQERIDLIDFGLVQCLPGDPATLGLTARLNF